MYVDQETNPDDDDDSQRSNSNRPPTVGTDVSK